MYRMFGACCMPFDGNDLEEPEFEVRKRGSKNMKKTLQPSQEQKDVILHTIGRMPRSNLEWCQARVPNMRIARRYAASVASEKGMFVIGGCDNSGASLRSIEYCGHDSREEWTTLRDMEFPTSGLAAVMKDENSIVVLGGYHGCRRQALAFVYNIRENQWQQLPRLNQRRGGCSAAVLHGEVYAVGGHDGSIHLSSIEVFQEDQWKTLPARMRERRSDCATVVVGGAIYVVGGENERGVLSSAECYQDGQWEPLPPMRIPRKGCAVAAVQQYIVVAGGYDGSCYLDSCEMFDTITQKWREIPSLSTVRGYCVAVATQKSICVIGGFDGSRCLSFVEKLDILHIVPTPPTIREEPKIEAGDGTQRFAIAEWMSHAHVAVDTFTSSVKSVNEQVHRDYDFKQRSIHKQIEALRKELNQAAVERDVFLNDLSSQTNPWFRHQQQRIANVKAGLQSSGLITNTRPNKFGARSKAARPDSVPTSSSYSQDELTCPITLEIMRDPVLASDGNTYERAAIVRFFERPVNRVPISPKTNRPFPSRILVDNVNVRNMCRDYQMLETREDSETQRISRGIY